MDEVSFSIEANEIVGVSGPSGSGKTTVALALLGLLPVDASISGTIAFDGRDLGALDERTRDEIRGAHIGIVFQESALALNPVSHRRRADERRRSRARAMRSPGDA